MTAVRFAQDAGAPTVAVQMAEMLKRGGSGHSPTTEEVEAAEAETGLADADVAKTVAPLLVRGLNDPDAAMRKYTLALMVGMQSLLDAEQLGGEGSAAAAPRTPVPSPSKGANTGVTAAAGLAVYKAEVAKALLADVPAIGSRLTDDDNENRLLAATVLGGFSPGAPSSVYQPLLAFLKRDDAIGPVGLAVATDLVQLGPVNEQTAAAIGRYLRRSDLTTEMKASLVEALSAKPNQNQALNKAMLSYLESDDAGLRARVILSLPAMDLSPDVFADTRAKVSGIAEAGQENPQVVNAAKAVASCWTQVRMTTGCPNY